MGRELLKARRKKTPVLKVIGFSTGVDFVLFDYNK